MIDLSTASYRDMKGLFIKSLIDNIIPYTVKNDDSESFYIDFDSRINKSGHDLYLIGNMLYRHVSYLDISAIGGLSALNSLFVSVSMAWSYRNHLISEFMDIFEINGEYEISRSVNPGDSVALVHDVITTCENMNRMIVGCLEYGLNIPKIIILVNMSEHDGCLNDIKIKYPDTVFEYIIGMSELELLHNIKNY